MAVPWCLPQHHFPFLSGSPSFPFLRTNKRLSRAPHLAGRKVHGSSLRERGVGPRVSPETLRLLKTNGIPGREQNQKRTQEVILSPWNSHSWNSLLCESVHCMKPLCVCACKYLFLLKLSCVMFLFFKDFEEFFWWGWMGTCKRMKQSNS